MNKNTIRLANVFILLAIFINGYTTAFAETIPLVDLKSMPAPKNPPPIPAPIAAPKAPDTDAAAYILIDAETGKVLAEKNADTKRAPASLTKLMTMYVVSNAIRSGALSLDSKVHISKKAWQMGGSKMFVRVDTDVPVLDLIQGIIVASGNDACVAMAEQIAGSEDAFAQLMNQQAQALGMSSSHFTDSTGMPHPNHFVTARDMAVLARAIIKHYPEDYKWYKEKWFNYNGIRQPNRNRLLWRDPDADGLKTGHTDEAGFCLAASAVKNGMRLISIVLGAPSDESRAQDSQALLGFGFRFFESHKVYTANQVIDKPRVWLGQFSNTPVGVAKDLVVTIPSGQYRNLKANVQLEDTIKAPLTKGQTLGQLVLTLNDQVIEKAPVVALEDNASGGFWSRMKDKIALATHRFSRDSDKESADNKTTSDKKPAAKKSTTDTKTDKK